MPRRQSSGVIPIAGADSHKPKSLYSSNRTQCSNLPSWRICRASELACRPEHREMSIEALNPWPRRVQQLGGCHVPKPQLSVLFAGGGGGGGVNLGETSRNPGQNKVVLGLGGLATRCRSLVKWNMRGLWAVTATRRVLGLVGTANWFSADLSNCLPWVPAAGRDATLVRLREGCTSQAQGQGSLILGVS